MTLILLRCQNTLYIFEFFRAGVQYGYVANSGTSSATSGPAAAPLSSSSDGDDDEEDEDEDEEAGLLWLLPLPLFNPCPYPDPCLQHCPTPPCVLLCVFPS